MALATTENARVSPNHVKQRAAGLLGRCVTNPVCLNDMEKRGDAKKIGEAFGSMVVGGGTKWNEQVRELSELLMIGFGAPSVWRCFALR